MLRNLLLLIGLYAVWRMVRSALGRTRRRPDVGSRTDDARYRDLTDQEISDADYEDLDRK